METTNPETKPPERRTFILDEKGEPKEVPSGAWAAWLLSDPRSLVAMTELLGGAKVGTIFSGLECDRCVKHEEAPRLYVVGVEGSSMHGHHEHHATREGAARAHVAIVARLLGFEAKPDGAAAG